ncbi:hypothetical protein T459_05713 [Capsicum annuum]|uniref:Replication factor A C-terminal domain-containing protein n=1 Tax=Capsicum annuum TaxID=4072 RepID=A0A2G3A8R6_CAPAN|nr:hypothetical protein T459_05713 [Capsicum annuum]
MEMTKLVNMKDSIEKGILMIKRSSLVRSPRDGLRSWYRLQVHVMDGTDLITLLLWNREAMQLMGKTAKELKEGLIDDDDCSYPSELDDIVEKKTHDSLFEGAQNKGGDELFETPIKNNLSGCGSSVTEISVDSIEKQYTKRSKGVGKLPMQEYDDECNEKQSTNKIRKVIKKEKKHE